MPVDPHLGNFANLTKIDPQANAFAYHFPWKIHLDFISCAS